MKSKAQEKGEERKEAMITQRADETEEKHRHFQCDSAESSRPAATRCHPSVRVASPERIGSVFRRCLLGCEHGRQIEGMLWLQVLSHCVTRAQQPPKVGRKKPNEDFLANVCYYWRRRSARTPIGRVTAHLTSSLNHTK